MSWSGSAPQVSATSWYHALDGKTGAAVEVDGFHQTEPYNVKTGRKVSRRRRFKVLLGDDLESGIGATKGLAMWREWGGALFLCFVLCAVLIGVALTFSSVPNSTVQFSASVVPVDSARSGLSESAAVPAAQTQTLVRIPIRAQPKARNVNLAQLESPVKSPEAEASDPAAAPASVDATAVPLYDHRDMEYLVDIEVGAPPHTQLTNEQASQASAASKFSVILDTGSSDLWVASSQCGKPCKGHNVYRSTTAESSDKESFSIKYGEGKVRGFYNTDDVKLGTQWAANVTIGESVEIAEFSPSFSESLEFDGILGVAWPSLASNKKQPLLNAMIDQKLISRAMFSLYLGSNKTGELVLGGYDENLMNLPIHWLYMSKDRIPTYWEVPIEAMQVSVRSPHIDIIVSFSTSSKSALIDSGTSYFTGPSEDVKALADAVGAKELSFGQSLSDGRYFLECNKTSSLPNVEFELPESPEGIKRRIIVSPEDYVVQPSRKMFEDPGMCVFAFLPLEFPSEPKWILGDIFMRKHYTVFDFEKARIGFAPLAASS